MTAKDWLTAGAFLALVWGVSQVSPVGALVLSGFAALVVVNRSGILAKKVTVT